MNYDATIRQLKERRDFYAAAVAALEKIQAHEGATETPQRTTTRRKARRHGRWNPTPDHEIVRTMTWDASAAAKELGISRATIYQRRAKLAASKPNGSAGDPIAVQ